MRITFYHSGLILSWDKYLTKDIWVSIDYASGDSYYGVLSAGASYNFAPNVSVIFGYVYQTNRDLASVFDTFTTQLDINI